MQSSISEGYNGILLCLRPEAGYVVYVMQMRRSLADLFCNNWQYLELLSKKLHTSLCARLLNCFFRNILSSAVLWVKLRTVCLPLATRDWKKKVRIVFSRAISLIPELNQSLGVELSKTFQLRNLAEENKQTKSKAEEGIFFSEYSQLNVKIPYLSLSQIFCKIQSNVYFGKQTSCAAVGTGLCMRFFLKPLISRWSKACAVQERRGGVSDA